MGPDSDTDPAPGASAERPRGLDLLIRAARAVVDGRERPCVVGIADGTIVALHAEEGEGPPGPSETGDAPEVPASWHARETVVLGADQVLLPGLVDIHVHVDDPGRADWEGFAHATRAAAAGGVTTIVDMPLNSLPPTIDEAALSAKRQAATGRCHVDVAFWGGAVPGNHRQLERLWAAGVLGFKCFLADSGVPEFPPLDEHGLESVMTEVAAFGGLLLVHAEDQDALVACPPRTTRYRDFAASRPASAEVSAVSAVVAAARRTGCRTHVVHVSSARALDVLAAAHDEGVPVTAETCPHYLTLAAEDVPDGATVFACCPPIRDAGNRDALWRGLAAGTLSCVASDHSPCPPELKALDSGCFDAAWGGIGSLELGLAVVWSEARRRGHTLADVASWMSTGPAARADLWRKGAIAVGRDADLCAVDPEASRVVDPARLEQRHKLTPYAGRTLAGVVRTTWLAGRRVDRRDPPRGRLLAGGGAR